MNIKKKAYLCRKIDTDMNKNEKKNRTHVTININTLVGNMIVVTSENEASEVIEKRFKEILLNVLKSAQSL